MSEQKTADIIKLDVGVVVFPKGVEDFCKRLNADMMYIDSADGGMVTYTIGDLDFKDVPPVAEAPVVSLSNRRKRDENQDS